MKTAYRLVLILLICSLAFGCSYQSISDENDQLCPGLPEGFSTDDLIGIWVVSYSLNDTDTIIINADGTYKQIYNDPDANFRYESDLAEWTIEYRENNLARIHLKGMKRAGELESIFNRDGGGVDPELFTSIDYCENEIVNMTNEIVLIVSGASYETPRGIILRQTRLSGSEWTWSFELSQE